MVGRRLRDGNTHFLEGQASSVSWVTDAEKGLRNRLSLLHGFPPWFTCLSRHTFSALVARLPGLAGRPQRSRKRPEKGPGVVIGYLTYNDSPAPFVPVLL